MEPTAPAPRRVLIDLRGLEPSGVNGGLQTYVTWLLPWLIEHHREKFSFLALARHGNAELASALLGTEDAVWIESELDAPMMPASAGRPAVACGSWSVEQAVQRLGIQTIYAPLGPLRCTPPPGVHSVALVADMLHMEMPECLDYEIVQRRTRYIDHLAKHASLIQCISHSSEERLLHHVPEAAGKTFYSYLPVHQRFKNAPAEDCSTVAPSSPYFFYPANFWPHKNHLALILAYHQYLREFGTGAWNLVLSGADYQEGMARVRATADALHLSDRITFSGYVSDSELGNLWRNAAALVFPSLHEGFGIPLIEAMHYRVPIITSPSYSLLEIAGPAALYFNPRKPEQLAARMIELSRSPELIQELRGHGDQRLTRFHDADEPELVVEAILGHHPQRPPSNRHAVCGCPT